MDEDWEVLSSHLPSDWREQAAIHGALKGLRKDKSADVLLRMLLMHLGCGHSLRETATRARQAGIADMSDVALFKRLRKSKEWLRALCVGMYRECGVELGASGGFQVRAFDGSVVKEPGRTGSLWRVHYSLRLPGGRRPFDLLAAVSAIKRVGAARSWRARAVGADREGVVGRVCAMRKSAEDAERAREKLRRRASRNGNELRPETLEFAGCVIVFTTFPADRFSAAEVLRWYRVRWQVELTFKRCKSLAGLGHLPKRADDSARAWLYGKLLVALLAEKLARRADSRAVSPCGRETFAQPLAGVQVRVESSLPSR